MLFGIFILLYVIYLHHRLRQQAEQLAHLTKQIAILSSAGVLVETTTAPTPVAADELPTDVLNASVPASDLSESPERHEQAIALDALPVLQPVLEPDEQSPHIVTSVLASLKSWFTGGNLIVRLGSLVLLVGVAFLLHLTSQLFHVGITGRLIAIATVAIGLVGLGWRVRPKRRGYGLSLQGLGLAILYLTLSAAQLRYGLLSPEIAFGGLACLVALTAWLAQRQNALPLALLAFGGGFAAPLLSPNISHELVPLFTTYLILNIGLAWLAHRRAWKLLNLMGMLTTFGLAMVLGWLHFDPSERWALEALLIAHVVLYGFIALRYGQHLTALKQQGAGRDQIPALDISLLFGMPLLALAVQATLMHGINYAMAISTAVLALAYLTLAAWLRRHTLPGHIRATDTTVRQPFQLLHDGTMALGTGFLALVLPLIFSAYWSASGWLIQGAALVWLGRRTGRRVDTSLGVLLQVLGLIALVIATILETPDRLTRLDSPFGIGLLVATLSWLYSGYWLSRRQIDQLTRWQDATYGATLLGVAAGFTWAWQLSVSLSRQWNIAWQDAYWFIALWGVIFALSLIADRLRWIALQRYMRLSTIAITLLTSVWLFAQATLSEATLNLAGWLAASMALIGGLISIWFWAGRSSHYLFKDNAQRGAGYVSYSAKTANDQAWIWLASLLTLSQVGFLLWPRGGLLAQGMLPLLATLALFYMPRTPVWLERRAIQASTRGLTLSALLFWAFLVNMLDNGQVLGLPYLPLLSLIDVMMLGIGAIIWQALSVSRLNQANALVHSPRRKLLISVSAFSVWWWLTGMVVRTLHQWAGTPGDLLSAWSSSLLQSTLTLVWAAVALGLTVLSSRRGWRLSWLGGVSLLGLVGLKLLLVDLSAVSALARVVSFIGVGIIMLIIGYIAPLPPAIKPALQPPENT